MANSETPRRGEEIESALRTRTWSEKVRTEEAGLISSPDLVELKDRSAEFNAKAHSALSNIPVPPQLRDQILASNKIIRVPFWRTPRALALAAGLALLATGLIFFARAPREDQTFAGFRNRMIGFALREYRMDIYTNSLPAVEQFLSAKGTPSNLKLPPTLAQAPVKGGAALAWRGKPVSMVCFERKETTIYMFVLDQPTGAVNFAHRDLPDKGVSTATWSFAGKTYFLAAKLPQSELEQLVPIAELERAAKS
ncbi:MAG TPA: hypothetical protein VF773_21800 [Verrucomicrobiae bacterium]